MRRKPVNRLLMVCMATAIVAFALCFSMYKAGNRLQQPDNEGDSGKIIWENLSHRFFTSF